MANATAQDYVESVQEYVVNNVDDPNPDRDNSTNPETGNWVYNTEPVFDLNVYPRIHIHSVDDEYETFEIGRDSGTGKIRMQNTGRLQITVIVGQGSGNKLDVDGDGEKERPDRVLDSLKTDIVDAIKNNQSRWRNLGDNALSLIPEIARQVRTDQNSVKAKAIDARIDNIR